MRETVSLELALIEQHPDLQPRVALLPKLVTHFAERMSAGDKFPPLRVFQVGERRFLTRGRHRAAAYERRGVARVECELVAGSWAEALTDAVAADAHLAQRRTRADGQRCIKLLLGHPGTAQLSDREIARLVGTTHPTVARARKDLGRGADGGARLGKDGRKRRVRPTPSGKSFQTEDVVAESDGSLDVAGVAVLDPPAVDGIVRSTTHPDLDDTGADAPAEDCGRTSSGPEARSTERQPSPSDPWADGAPQKDACASEKPLNVGPFGAGQTVLDSFVSARHEAGHALAAHLLDVPQRSLTVGVDGWAAFFEGDGPRGGPPTMLDTGDTDPVSVGTPWSDRDHRLRIETTLMVLVAGDCAADDLRGLPLGASPTTDARTARGYAGLMTTSDGSASTYVAYLEERTLDLLRVHRAALCALTAALFERGHLEAAEVAQLLATTERNAAF